jgi:pilus assembly protein CpaF
MSAFGRKTGVSGIAAARPSFGVARPMQGSTPAKPAAPPPPQGGDQFPPLPGSDPLAWAAATAWAATATR